MHNRITNLFQIKYPIIQGGMIWCSGWKLAAAVSNNGGLGLIGAGSMHPETLEIHIKKIKKATQKSFGVNVPLLYPEMDKIMDIIIREQIPIVFTSAGNPKTWTKTLQQNGIKVAHVIANTKFAIKCQDADVDAIVAEGFEAGGHNGREETTTMSLIPQIRKAIEKPLIAAGGIGSGQAMAAAFALGAEGVQVGSRFAATVESSAHGAFKSEIIKANEGDTQLTLKNLAPVRLLNNPFYQKVLELENQGASIDAFKQLLGNGRAKKGMFEGDIENGELEIGQISAGIHSIDTVAMVIKSMVNEFNQTISNLSNLKL